MPSTPKIVTRSETTSTNTTENLGKGSKLTFAEMDSNFIELKNGSIGIVGDDSTGIDIAQGSTLKVAGTGGIATSVSGDTLTVDASSIVTTSLGDLTAVGSTLIAPSNADLTLSASGTGAIVTADTVELTQNTNLTPNLVVSGYSSTFLKLGNHPTESNQGNSIFGEGGPLYLAATGSNNVISENDITIETGNISAPNDVNMTLSVSGTGQISVDGATIGSNSIELDQLTISGNSIRTNVTNANLEFDTNGTGNIFLGDIEVAAHLANRDTFTALNIPFSSDGSTSQDVSINLDSQGDPNITFNHASTANGAGAKIKTNTGNLILQSGSQRIELAANTVQIGNNTIVVSGNRMSTDASNEDLEFDANGTGNVSSLAQLNMNSNKITNVTDPASAQDAATKAYVDTQDANIASDTLTFTNKTFDANGTGNSISNIEVADLASGVVDTDLTSVSASDDTLASAKAIKSYVDSQSHATTGDITFVGSTMNSPSNANFTIETAGTGKIILTGITFPDTDGTANQILGTNGSGVLSFRDPTAINIDGGVADSTYTSVPTIDGGTA